MPTSPHNYSASNELVQCCFDQLLQYLDYDHAQVRLAAVEIIEMLFARSALYRALLVQDFQTFLRLTVDLDSESLVPPPK